MSGSAMRTMEASIVAISMPSVVMNSAVHLWRSLTWAGSVKRGGTVMPSPLGPPAGPLALCCVGCRLLVTSQHARMRFRNTAFRLC